MLNRQLLVSCISLFTISSIQSKAYIDPELKAVNHYMLADQSDKLSQRLEKEQNPTIISRIKRLFKTKSTYDKHANASAEQRKLNFEINTLYHATKAVENEHPLAFKKLNKLAHEKTDSQQRFNFLEACKKSKVFQHTVSKKSSFDYVEGLGIMNEALEGMKTKYNEPASQVYEKNFMYGWEKIKDIDNTGLQQNLNRVMQDKLKNLEQIAEHRKLVFSPKFINQAQEIFSQTKTQ